MGPGKGGSSLVHVGTNNEEREGTKTKYRQLARTLKQPQVEQIIISGILSLVHTNQKLNV